MYCSNCGEEFSSKAKFCSKCGYRLKRLKAGLMGIILLSILILLGVGAFYVYNNSEFPILKIKLETAIGQDAVLFRDTVSGDANKSVSYLAIEADIKSANLYRPLEETEMYETELKKIRTDYLKSVKDTRFEGISGISVENMNSVISAKLSIIRIETGLLILDKVIERRKK